VITWQVSVDATIARAHHLMSKRGASEGPL
jgi:hypothetical protein